MPCTKCKDGKYKWGESGECKYETKEACENANKQKHKEMSQPTPLGKTYEEYQKELSKYNLSKIERVDLTVVGDLSSATKSVSSLTKSYKSAWSELSDNITNTYLKVEDLRQEYIQISKQVKSYKSANDSYAPAFQKLMQNKGKIESAEKNLQQTIQAGKSVTKELGLNFKDLPGMGEALDISQWNIDTMKMIDSDLNRMSRTIAATDDNVLDIIS